MNAARVPAEQIEAEEQESSLAELTVTELAYVGGGMANFSFV